MKQIPTAIRTLRRKTIKSIRDIVTPKLRDSGFKTDPKTPFDFSTSKYLQLVAFKKDEVDDMLGIKIPWATSLKDWCGSEVDTIIGFVERGVIVDAHGGALVIQDYRTICVEDLCRIEAVIKKLKPEEWY